MFRKKTVELKKIVVHADSAITDAGDEDLLGLDAEIPGGRFDLSVDPKLKCTPPTL
jgi:hypothetical protein